MSMSSHVKSLANCLIELRALETDSPSVQVGISFVEMDQVGLQLMDGNVAFVFHPSLVFG